MGFEWMLLTTLPGAGVWWWRSVRRERHGPGGQGRTAQPV